MKWYILSSTDPEPAEHEYSAEEMAAMRPSARPAPDKDPYRIKDRKRKRKNNLWRKSK